MSPGGQERPLLKVSNIVHLGKDVFRVASADNKKTRQRYIKAEFTMTFRANQHDYNVVEGRRFIYGEIDKIIVVQVGSEELILVQANWFQPDACTVCPRTHNVMVDRSRAWWRTKETVMRADDITAQVVIVNIPKSRPFDVQRAVILDKTPLYPPTQLGGVPRLVIPT